ncbi:hypothetical protein BDV09DRAFT_190737 [Aspergillus tetrazonus]
MVYWGHHQLWAHNGKGAQVIFEIVYSYNGQYYFACLPGMCIFFLGGLRCHYMTVLHLFRICAIPESKSTYLEELWGWYVEFKNFSFIFHGGGEPCFTYNFHAWLIPVEFWGLITIYIVLLAISRFHANIHICSHVLLIFYFLYIADGWFCALFMASMILCKLDLAAQVNKMPAIRNKLRTWKKPIFYSLFAISMYLGGIPSHTADLQAISTTSESISSGPRHCSWHPSHDSQGSARFFELPFNQYLGCISFAFYLVHGPVLWARVSHLTTCPGWIDRLPLPRVGPLRMEFSFPAPHFILLPVTLWLAEVVTRVVDGPSVQFTSWLYGKLLALEY